MGTRPPGGRSVQWERGELVPEEPQRTCSTDGLAWAPRCLCLLISIRKWKGTHWHCRTGTGIPNCAVPGSASLKYGSGDTKGRGRRRPAGGARTSRAKARIRNGERAHAGEAYTLRISGRQHWRQVAGGARGASSVWPTAGGWVDVARARSDTRGAASDLLVGRAALSRVARAPGRFANALTPLCCRAWCMWVRVPLVWDKQGRGVSI